MSRAVNALAALDKDMQQGAAHPIARAVLEKVNAIRGPADGNRSRAALFDDVVSAAVRRLSRLDALGEQLDDLATDLARAPAGSPERVRLRAVLFGLLQGLRCCQVLTNEQAAAFAARMRQGIAEGWL